MTEKVCRVLLVVCVCAMGNLVTTDAAAASFPVINSATYDAATQILTISGENLAASNRLPSLEFNDAPLTVTTATATEVTATLPSTTPPGSYVIVLHRSGFGLNGARFEVNIGAAGAHGAPGIQGPMGFQGPQGVAGPQGPAGANGPQGNPGAAGSVGPQGPAGPAGGQGPAGNAGANGPQGNPGAAGSIGAQGPAGPAGGQGLTGNAGANGVAGLAGPKGDTGAQGPAGLGATVGDALPGSCGSVAGMVVTDGANKMGLVCDGKTGAPGPVGPAGPAGPAGGGTPAWSAIGDLITVTGFPPLELVQKSVSGSSGYSASASLSMLNAQWTVCNLLAISNGSTTSIDKKSMHPLSANTSAPMQLQGIFQPVGGSAVLFQLSCYDTGGGSATANGVSLIVTGVALQP
jgi:hypothetical protein